MALVKDKKTAAEPAKGAAAQGPEQVTETPVVPSAPEVLELQKEVDEGTPATPEAPAVQEGTTEQPPEQLSDTGETQEAEEGGELDAEDAAEPEAAEKPRLLKVSSKAKMTLRQPSSGWTIKSGETREMLNDGWLGNQLRARLFEIA